MTVSLNARGLVVWLASADPYEGALDAVGAGSNHTDPATAR